MPLTASLRQLKALVPSTILAGNSGYLEETSQNDIKGKIWLVEMLPKSRIRDKYLRTAEVTEDDRAQLLKDPDQHQLIKFKFDELIVNSWSGGQQQRHKTLHVSNVQSSLSWTDWKE